VPENLTKHFRYSAAKRQLIDPKVLGMKDGIAAHFTASLIAGTVATTICAPADVLKSRIQSAATSGGVSGRNST